MEKLLKLQDILHNIVEQMTALHPKITMIQDCIMHKKLIPQKEITEIIPILYDIKDRNTQYEELCQQLEFSTTLCFDKIEEQISQAIKDYKLKEKLEQYKFLLLKSKDTKTDMLLEAKKQELIQYLSNNEEEQKLIPFQRFVDAVLELDSVKLVKFTTELSETFSDELVAKAVFDKTIYLPENSIEKKSEMPKQTEKEIPEETEKETLKEILPLLITDTSYFSPYDPEISKQEKKAFGAKTFIKDMIKYKENPLVFQRLAENEFATQESIALEANMLKIKLPQDMIELSLEYMHRKGYLRKYTIKEIGSFYCISPKGAKAFQSQDARKFLNHIKPYTYKEIMEENIFLLTRAVYAKVMSFYYQYVKGIILKPYNKIDAHSFIVQCAFRKKMCYIIGAFWTTVEEAESQSKELKEKLTENDKNIVIAGINVEFAQKIAAYFVKNCQLDTSFLCCYGAMENKFVRYENGETIDSMAMLENNMEEKAEQKTEQKIEKPEEVKSEEVKQTELQKTIQEVQKTKDTIITVQEKNYDESKKPVALEKILTNACHMIVEGKTYCAVSYLKSFEDMTWYQKLAYAVNAPDRNCSYCSEEIFELYPDSDDIFSEYLMTTATLRNFFMNHIRYDYSMKSLHESVKKLPIVSDNVELTNLIYHLFSFKEHTNQGIDFYADYKVKDKAVVEQEQKALAAEAKAYYDSYVIGPVKETTSHRRFMETRKLIFSQENDFVKYLKAISENDIASVELIHDYLADTFFKDNCSIELSNMDKQKLNNFIENYWNEAGKGMRVARKTSDLMSSLRSNLMNSVEKVVCVMCKWTILTEENTALKEDDSYYQEKRKEILSSMQLVVQQLTQKKDMLIEEMAGRTILKETITEFISRLDGSYEEKQQKYYYIDFLRQNYVLLQDDFLPDTRGKFEDFQEFSLSNRILKHAKAELMTFEQKLDNIFNQYGDDYGTAELLVTYLSEKGKTIEYNIEEWEKRAAVDAKLKLDGFIENLELAQSYGQIEESKENKKEKIQKIANEWYEYARASKNYGFFKMVLEQYTKKIHEDAKVRGTALSQEVEQRKMQYKNDLQILSKIEKIEKAIEQQNYTVAEDLLARIHIDESEEVMETAKEDYLTKFIEEYDQNYRPVADSGRKLKDLIHSHTRNKDDRGAKKLIDNWMANGEALTTNKLDNLLEALGFTGAKTEKQEGKLTSYIVKIHPKKIYKHSIAAFGSKAQEEGFRVVCLFGKYDADRLIEEFKNIAGTKNTLILLDYALTLPERRRLARKVKSDMGEKVFAVLDRVALMFLISHYNIQFINQMLMAVIMPFSYYQPYVWDSAKVMPPEIFIGRKEELEKIESPSGVNIVYGGRQLGKSALLKKAKMDIDGNENQDRAILVELKGLDYQKAAKKIGHELYDTKVLTEDIDTTDWDELARAIKKRLQNEELPKIPYLLLLLDEADAFIESCEKVNFQPFDALKEIQSVGIARFKFVIAGLHNIVRFKRDAALSNNSVLTHLTSITVKPFHRRDAQLLLKVPLHYLGFRFPEDKLVSLILASTNYFPGLIQLYCANLIEAMRKGDYAGYSESNTPVYEIEESHIKKVLADPDFMNQIREKVEITLKLDEDNLYYIIALLLAHLYRQNSNSASEKNGFSARDIMQAAQDCEIKKIMELDEIVINGLLQELLELNILRQTTNDLYLFLRYSFFQMMGTSEEVEEKLIEYMED